MPVDAVIGEILHERALARRDERHVDVDALGHRFPSARASRASCSASLDAEQRFARHAAAQDAQAAERSAIDQRDVAPEIAGRARRRITARTRADDDEVVRAARRFAVGFLSARRARAEPVSRFDKAHRSAGMHVGSSASALDCRKKRTPRTRSPSVMPVAQKMTSSLLTRSSISRTRSRSPKPIATARSASSSLRGCSRPMKLPPKHLMRGGGQHAFGRAAGAHRDVNSGRIDGGRDAGIDVAVGDQPDARARRRGLRESGRRAAAGRGSPRIRR